MNGEATKPTDGDRGCETDPSKFFGASRAQDFSIVEGIPGLQEPESIQNSISSLVLSITQELVRASPLSSSGSEYIPRVPLGERLVGCESVIEEIRRRSSEDYLQRLPIPPSGSLSSMLSQSSSASPISSQVASSAGDDSLPQVLHALDGEDDSRIVVVRRITKLGFKSGRIIKNKFQEFGWVVKTVVLLPSRSRLTPQDLAGGAIVPIGHLRPSSMGFVVFASEKAAKECLAVGSVNIDGVHVIIQPFMRQYKPTRDE